MKATAPLAALLLAACTPISPPNSGPTAAIGEIASVSGLRIRPLRVIEDSRCPTNVRCIWAGRLVVRSEISGGSWHQTRDLELGKPQRIADGTLTLVAVSPEKAATSQIDPATYRFT
ncbi:MAG TPA: hypothetical protein VKH44_01900, partial [Pirellulaceae bacterium]|nr:hypothetical protein [Pirellulaceae bacterium]